MKKLTTFFLTLIVFVPLVIDNHVFLPETSGKAFMFSVFMVLAMLSFAVGLWIDQSFRRAIFEKMKFLVKNPLVIAVMSFVGIYIVAALLSIDKSSAFWGTLSRSEGIVGILCFFMFFVLMNLVFDKRDWLRFFKCFLVVVGVILFKEGVQIFHGVDRPASFIGNPAFLAGYLLFGLLSAWIVTTVASEKYWKVIGWVALPFILIGLLFTQTRGTMLGVAVGVAVLLVFAIYYGKNLVYKKVSLRLAATVLVIAGMIFSGLFITTRANIFWQSIPGFSRLANISAKDNTTNVRLLVWKTGLDSVSPYHEPLSKSLIGWGPENFYLAFEKYYRPEIFSNDTSMFDRPHNKLVEELVTTGILGLIAYLTIWFFLIKSIHKIPELKVRAGLYFISIAYLVHLMFLFDVITTSIGFMILLSFTLSYQLSSPYSKKDEKSPRYEFKGIVAIAGMSVISLVIMYAFFAGIVTGYVRMHKYVALVTGNSAASIIKGVPQILKGGYTPIDTLIVGDFLNQSARQYNTNKDPQIKSLLDSSISLGEGYVTKNPLDYRLIVTMINALNSRGDADSLVKAEKYINTLIAQSPNFPRYQYMLALNLGQQKQFDEATVLFEKLVNTIPDTAILYYQYGWISVMQGPLHYDRAIDLFEHAFTMAPGLFGDNLDKNRAVYKVFTEYFAYRNDKLRLQMANTRLEVQSKL